MPFLPMNRSCTCSGCAALRVAELGGIQVGMEIARRTLNGSRMAGASGPITDEVIDAIKADIEARETPTGPVLVKD